jgi:SAM-dependent methyltransferase
MACTKPIKPRVSARPLLRSEASRRKFIADLYRNIDGSRLAKDEGRLQANRSTVYGELTTRGLGKLVTRLHLTRRDVFYDLGCGTGKVILEIAATVPLKKCVGIEIAKSRLMKAETVAGKVREQGLLKARQFELRHENFLNSDFSDATVLYTCSTCFSDNLMKELTRKIAALNRELLFITFQDLVRDHHNFQLLDTWHLDTSWKKGAAVRVYKVVSR